MVGKLLEARGDMGAKKTKEASRPITGLTQEPWPEDCDTDQDTLKLRLGAENKAPRTEKEHFKSIQKKPAKVQGVDALATEDPIAGSQKPEKFGLSRKTEGTTNADVTISRRRTLNTISEKDHMRRAASTHSLMRYE